MAALIFLIVPILAVWVIWKLIDRIGSEDDINLIARFRDEDHR